MGDFVGGVKVVPDVLFVDKFGKDHAVDVFLHDMDPVCGEVVRVVNDFDGPGLIKDGFELLEP